MSLQYDLQAGIDISSLASVTQAELMQMVNQAGPLNNVGGILCFDGSASGATGVGFPDVTSNPRFVRYTWLDTEDRTNPVLKRYKGTYTGSPANPSGMSNLYTDWSAVGVANSSLLTAMFAAASTTGGVDIGLLKRASDGSADAAKRYYVVRIDSAGQYVEAVALDSILADGGGVALNRLSTTGTGAQKYLGVDSGSLGYKYIDPANDITLAIGNRIPIGTCIAPGTAKYILRTNAAGTAAEWVASNDATLFNSADLLLSFLAAGGASVNDILKYDGANWVKVALGAHIQSVATSYSPGTLVSAANVIATAALSGNPSLVRCVLRCISADTYSVGSEINLDSFWVDVSGEVAFSQSYNATDLKLRVTWDSSAAIRIRDTAGTAFNIDKTKWAVKLYYWL